MHYTFQDLISRCKGEKLPAGWGKSTYQFEGTPVQALTNEARLRRFLESAQLRLEGLVPIDAPRFSWDGIWIRELDATGRNWGDFCWTLLSFLLRRSTLQGQCWCTALPVPISSTNWFGSHNNESCLVIAGCSFEDGGNCQNMLKHATSPRGYRHIYIYIL